MNYRLVLATAIALTVSLSCAHAQQKSPFSRAPKDGARIYPGQIVITFKPGTNVSASIAQLTASRDSIAPLAAPLILRPQTIAFSLRTAFNPAKTEIQPNVFFQTWKAVIAYRSRPNVLSAEPIYLAGPFRQPNDPEYPRMWHYRSRTATPGGANFEGAWRKTVGNRNIKIAVIDTGILPNEPEFHGSRNILSGADLISDPWMANDGDGGNPEDNLDYDRNPTDPGDGVKPFECGLSQWEAMPNSWHGSHVSGTAGAGRTNDRAGIAGAIWKVSIIPVRVLGRCGGTTLDIAQAILWAAGYSVRGIPKSPHGPADVINLSLGGDQPCSSVQSTIQAAINDATKAGSIVVAAAGNSNADAAGFYPASCKNVITVAASDARGRLATSYSNYGKRIDIMAPGGDVHADHNRDGDPDGILSVVKNRYEHYNGTSMAAPHVAAAVALLLSQNPRIRSMKGPKKFDTVRDLLHASAAKRTRVQCPRPCGAGLLDAGALLSTIQQ